MNTNIYRDFQICISVPLIVSCTFVKFHNLRNLSLRYTAVDTGRKDVQDVFWKSSERSVYVLCLRGLHQMMLMGDVGNLIRIPSLDQL